MALITPKLFYWVEGIKLIQTRRGISMLTFYYKQTWKSRENGLFSEGEEGNGGGERRDINKHQKRKYLTIPEETEKVIRKILSSLKSHGGSGEGQETKLRCWRFPRRSQLVWMLILMLLNCTRSPQEKEHLQILYQGLQNTGIQKPTIVAPKRKTSFM